MTYSDILKEMKHHGMDDFCIERYEVEAVAQNKYLIHIIFDSEKKKNLFDCTGDRYNWISYI